MHCSSGTSAPCPGAAGDEGLGVLGKRPEHTHVIIDEVDPENWGFAGLLTTEYRRQQST